MTELRDIGGDLPEAIERIGVPSYVIDAQGLIRWMNPAAKRLFGDLVGRRFTSVVAPEDKQRAQELFARKIVGTAVATDAAGILIGPAGERISVDISAVRLTENHHIIGVFGQITDVEEDEPERPPLPRLTPRQAEVLKMLERGQSTEQIARELQLSPETVRNHVRRLLRTLGVHTRLEAVAVARHGFRFDIAAVS
jgi:PAS domain S-box-containing protein